LGEALNLRTADTNWSEGVLTVRDTKFGKSRLVPLHPSTCKVLAAYAKRRDSLFGARGEAHFFVNQNGNRLDKGEVYRRSMHSRDKSDCGPRQPATDRACMIFATV
jgi:site-specific recombinase XerD